MRALLQRVSHASVTVEDTEIGSCGPGLLILVCAMQGDTPPKAEQLAGKISKLRIFTDDAGKMNRSILDTSGSALVISQFTLAADTSRGNRPGFSAAALPEVGARQVGAFARELEILGVSIAQGQFGADMKVALVNDGPVTIWMDTEA